MEFNEKNFEELQSAYISYKNIFNKYERSIEILGNHIKEEYKKIYYEKFEIGDMYELGYEYEWIFESDGCLVKCEDSNIHIIYTKYHYCDNYNENLHRIILTNELCTSEGQNKMFDIFRKYIEILFEKYQANKIEEELVAIQNKYSNKNYRC